eukprot:gene21907-27984_t
MAHWTRKSYTNVKVSLMLAGVSPLTLAAMDSGFMFTYAAQLLHGAFQATGGPVNTAIMGNWWTAKGRGLVFGIWTCHQYVGDIIAAVASSFILSSDIDWRWCIVIPAVLNGIWAFVNLYYIPNRPEDIGIITEASQKKAAQDAENAAKNIPTLSIPDKHIGFFEAFMLPNVLSYALAFGFFKLVNYAMFFQLPVILSAHFDPSMANIISALYSVGMMPGGIVCGWVSDLYGGRRACVIATFMAILCPLLLVFAQAMDQLHIVVLLVLLAFMGCLVGGPNNIITSAVAADLADDPSIKGSKSALGTVTGIINGSGSVTAALGQLAIPVLYSMGLVDGVGYRYVWYFLIFCTIAGTLLLSGKVYKELYPRPESLLSHAHGSSRNGYSAVSGSEEEGVTMVKV